MKHGFPILPCLALSLAFSAQAADQTAGGIHQGPLESRVDALASIQPGLGVVMHEFAYRFANTYWAANGGNWGLAQYQLKELLEAQEVAEMTRPQRAAMLKANEDAYLVPLAKAIEQQDIVEFKRRFAQAEAGCNGCHAALGYAFIRYHVPEQPQHNLLDFSLKTEPAYQETSEPK